MRDRSGVAPLIAVVVAVVTVATVATLVVPRTLTAQTPPVRRSLQPQPPGGTPHVIPFFEGWYANPDGSYSLSFGYRNQDSDETIVIPLGDANLLEGTIGEAIPPTVFLPGRQRGVFAVTLPPENKDEDVWWTITSPGGEVARVPGRIREPSYQLDWKARPQGSQHPLVAFDRTEGSGRGPVGIVAAETLTATVGVPLTLTSYVKDPSLRDPSDHRFREPVPLRVTFERHRGAGEVEFTRHESTPTPPPVTGTGIRARLAAAAARAQHRVTVGNGEGTVKVYATFAEPGEYIVRVEVDNFGAPDSASGDQCCWSNGYVRVTVSG